MALQKVSEFTGLNIPKAYYKIMSFTVSCLSIDEPAVSEVSVRVQSFTNDTKEHIFGEEIYKFTSSDEGATLSVCYAELKKLAAFSSAIDV